jgi:hypothetical protein
MFTHRARVLAVLRGEMVDPPYVPRQISVCHSPRAYRLRGDEK